MRWPHKITAPPAPHHWGRGGPRRLLCALLLLSALGAGSVRAAPPASPAPASAAIPDYGGRDSAPLATGESAPNPAAQAGRAVEALILVLVGAAAVVYALKRFGLVQAAADGKPARIMLSGLGRSLSAPSGSSDSLVTVESSRTLPGGAMLHVVSVPGRTLLLAATSHTITAVAEWPDASGASEDAAFEDYLARADTPETGLAAANAHLRSLLSRPQLPPKDTP